MSSARERERERERERQKLRRTRLVEEVSYQPRVEDTVIVVTC